MKSIVHEALCNVFHFDSRAGLQGAHVQDTFMRYEILLSLVNDAVVGFQPFGNIVGIENRDPARFSETSRPHHGDVNPGNCQNAGASPWGRGYGTDSMFPAYGHNRVPGEELR